MSRAIRWFAFLSLAFGLCSLAHLGFLGLTIATSAITISLSIGHFLDTLREQVVEIAKAHFDRQDHEESLK